jgi:hypothetical protein
LLGDEAVPLSKPFGAMVNKQLRGPTEPSKHRGAGPDNPWLFPSQNPGHHLAPQRVMWRLRRPGIDVWAARNTALQSLVAEVPPPIVAQLLGYSYNVTQRHAAIAAQPWSG